MPGTSFSLTSGSGFLSFISLRHVAAALLPVLLLLAPAPSPAQDLTGTNGDDTLDNPLGATVNNILGLDGNDVITNRGTVSISLNGGTGDDTITNSGTVEGFIICGDGNDIFVNFGLAKQNIAGGNGDDTITNYGAVNNNLYGNDETDTLILGAGSSVRDAIGQFEHITIQGPTTIGTMVLTDLTTMNVSMPAAVAPVTIRNFLFDVHGDLSVTITGGAFTPGVAVNVFSSGPAGFVTQTVTDSSLMLDFTIANAQVTATRVNTFDGVLPTDDPNALALAALFEACANDATGDMAMVIGLLNFMSPAELQEAFQQMEPLTGIGQMNLQGLQLGVSAVHGRMGQLAAAQRHGPSAMTLAASLTGTGGFGDQDANRAQTLETLRFASAVGEMFSVQTGDLENRLAALSDQNPDIIAADFASLDVALPEAGDLGPSFNLGVTNDTGVWARVLGSYTEQQDKDGIYGYEGRTHGLAGGVDHRFTDEFLAGIFASWTHAAMDFKDLGESGAMGDSYQVGLYGSYVLEDWFLEAAAAYTLGHWRSERYMTIGAMERVAESDQNTNGVNLSLNTGLEYRLDALHIRPVIGVEYAFTRESDYTEYGAGALNLSVEAMNRSSLRTLAGLELSYPLTIESVSGDLTLTPAFKAQWLHEFLDDEDISCSVADTVAVAMDSPEPERDTARLGLSLNLGGEHGVSGFVAYECDLRATAVEHGAALGMRVEF